MSRLPILLAVGFLSFAAMPASAGGIVIDLPRLAFPSDAPVDTNQSCLSPTSVTQACPDRK